jgi:TATA-binding protein-associated factor
MIIVQSQTKEKHSGKEEDHSIGASTTAGTGKGLKAMLNGLEELWDQSQYSEEYNLDQFVSRLNG